jgi:GH25 family lysozyme M1 (1,4-beta-N-acetylmuramidase)
MKILALSHWDTVLSWPTFLANILGALLKTSEGLLSDATFASRWPLFKPVLRGPFLFYRDSVDPIAQAKFFCDRLDEAGGLLASDMPATLDGEDKLATRKGKNLWPRVKASLDYIEARTRRRPMLYTAKWWWDSWMLDGLAKTPPPWAGDYLLHVAYYGNLSALPKMQPKGCQQPWTLWQYGGDEWGEAIPGLVGLGDVSRPYREGPTSDPLEWLKKQLGITNDPTPISDAEKLARLWAIHPDIH